MEVQIWVLSGLVTLLLIVVWFSVRNWVKRIDVKFDALIKAVQSQTVANVKQAGEINGLTKRIDVGETRLDDHSKRIRKIEIKTGNE